MQEEELVHAEETDKPILVDFDGTNVIVTPPSVNIERPGQQVIWVTHPDWYLTIEFKGGFPPSPCNKVKGRCHATFPPGRPGKYDYNATVTLEDGSEHSIDPDLIILY
ncbi:MAG TPA: hypothetical protein VM557_03040 [Thermoanaerobaculia bacterium]|nr:hypothetical protein [Thermoanaerobaculia bacterium]